MISFQIIACDTDSIFFKKPDCSFFTKEERAKLLTELNSLMPEKIRWEINDYFPKIITLKAKNYIMQTEDGKIKYKGSALKSSKTEPALKEFLYAIIQTILDEKYAYSDIYEKYVKEILNVKDITRWASKKSLTSTTYSSPRANETKIIDAIQGTELKEGDKAFLFFLEDGSLCLAEKFNGQYDKSVLLGKLFKVSKVFDAIIPKGTFVNYSLKKNETELEKFK